MFKHLKKLFYFCLSLSFLTHLLFIFHDQIYLELFFKLTPEQEKKLQVVENNEKSLEKTTHAKQDVELIKEMLEKDKQEIMSQAKNKFLAEAKKDSSIFQQIVAPNFKNFLHVQRNPKEIKQKSETNNISINYLGYVPQNTKSFPECPNKYYGLGLRVGNDNQKGQKSFWSISIVSPGSVAERIGIKVGDVLFGIKDVNGVFWEGNKYVAQKQIKNYHVIGVFKKDGKLFEKPLKLDEVCYEAN
jgi:hypothetical protein